MRFPMAPPISARLLCVVLLGASAMRALAAELPVASTGPAATESKLLPEKVRLDIREKQLALQQLTAQLLEAQLILERGPSQLKALREALQAALEAAAKEHRCQSLTEALGCVPAPPASPAASPANK